MPPLFHVSVNLMWRIIFLQNLVPDVFWNNLPTQNSSRARTLNASTSKMIIDHQHNRQMLNSTPAIHVDNDDVSVSSALPIISTGHARKPSDPSLLSPGILKHGRRSFNTSALDDGGPPSPTSSTQYSVHFQTAMALQDNKPSDGSTSLALPTPQDPSRSHSRRPSNATTTSKY